MAQERVAGFVVAGFVVAGFVVTGCPGSVLGSRSRFRVRGSSFRVRGSGLALGPEPRTHSSNPEPRTEPSTKNVEPRT